ncbi:unnamed protein product [Anisakis simplex]|uniref:Secreted RxLR effector peptide protein n=1 Tax=Anisakis simplex TaxID=6269 RepID=A0A0M3IY07_ANISI|nr:unnamed protein product [Anisakis simplex]
MMSSIVIALCFIAILSSSTCARAQKFDFSDLLGDEDDTGGPSSINMNGQAMDILKSLQLGDLEKDISETNWGIRRNAAQLVKQQMRQMRRKASSSDMMGNEMSELMMPRGRKMNLALREEGERGCNLESMDFSGLMASSSLKLKRAMATRLLRAASQLLKSSAGGAEVDLTSALSPSSSRLFMRRN